MIINFMLQMLGIRKANFLGLLLKPASASKQVQSCSLPSVCCLQVATKIWTAEDCEAPVLYEDIKMPEEKRLLPVMPKEPEQPPIDRRRKASLIRGPCFGEEARLKHGQFGLIALKGGWLRHGHFQMITNKVNRYIRKKPAFAEYRVEAPYHPVTRHPIQAVMGGGKGSIHHYVTPVKARQVVFEVAGKVQFSEVYPILRMIAMLLPFQGLAVSKETLDDMYEEERRIEEENENFFTFRELVEKNMQGIRTKISMYDYRYFGKLR